jgi:hypothetical protein
VNEECEDWEDWGVIVVEVGTSIDEVARRDGLGEGEGIALSRGVSRSRPMAQPCVEAGNGSAGVLEVL